MPSDQILEQISALLANEDDSTVNTSMRLPATLREAAALATEHLGLAPSTTAYTAQLLRSGIEASLLAAVLEAHYEDLPSDRPSLAEITLGVAEIDGNPSPTGPTSLRKRPRRSWRPTPTRLLTMSSFGPRPNGWSVHDRGDLGQRSRPSHPPTPSFEVPCCGQST